MEGVGASRRRDRHAAQEPTARRKRRRDRVGVAGTREGRGTHHAGGAAQVERVQLVLKLMLVNICGLFPPFVSNLAPTGTSEELSRLTLTVGGPLEFLMKINLSELSEVCRKAVKCACVTAVNKTCIHLYFIQMC